MTKTYNDIEAVTRLLEEVSFFIASGTWLSFILRYVCGCTNMENTFNVYGW